MGAAVVLGISACAPPTRPAFTPDATVDELEPTVQRDLPAPPVLTRTRDRLALQHVWLTVPLDAPLDDVWGLVDSTAIASTTLDALELNGIRVGILSAADWPGFQESLPSGTDASAPEQSLLSDHPLAIWRSPPLTGTIAVLPPDTSPLPTTYHTGGRLQLLLRLSRFAGQSYLDLIPHHHVTQPLPYVVVDGEVRLRTPLERELDGTLFNTLAIRTRVPAGGYLIVGLRRVHAAPAASSPAADPAGAPPPADATAATDAEAPKPIFSDEKVETPPLLPLMGTAIFTTRVAGGDVQRMLVIPLGG